MERDHCYECEKIRDHGPEPYIVNIAKKSVQNKNFRTALWTGNHLQVTLMNIPVGGEIGTELHPDIDQMIRVEQGTGIVRMGKQKDCLPMHEIISQGDVVFVPAGTWHNILNTGRFPLKLSSVYAPPHHPRGTVHETKADSDKADYH